ncbi:MAG: 5-formyltetrahydrofolate cyclo-ligase [Henriciella sp.]|uniref:5-formyltetrahydrofolate cyclo-ligase n=1 Tax=Henriciella sp. TaxID=1968823 RepID=UPI000C0D2558|nr:5-formyltetrahydrofolate cyclo-ligase [Henriciella sp.]MAN75097.1 5-formyltetrahydrofolate cyclo-ligase [Henriciella sp.]MBF33706.1 5-formyltetrahydrofolate cyclo-ligase [Hyphomonadaceae bacterium]PHR77903.1 MAG: 5-formyltetrahydrofolate cyclo-ligase [Henriciella sp.]
MSAEEKSALRKELKTLREEAHARDPDAGETLAAKFPLKLLERYGPVVAGYMPIGSEIDPQPLMARLEGEGAQLALPRLETKETMTFRAWKTGDALEKGPMGLQQPMDDAEIVTPTLILMPLLAFDNLGVRLGYGQGHYDKTIARLRDEGRVFACGLAFHAQMMDELPSEPHDQPLDWAVTERGSVPIFMMRAFRENAEEDSDTGGDGPGAA